MICDDVLARFITAGSRACGFSRFLGMVGSDGSMGPSESLVPSASSEKSIAVPRDL